MIPATFSISYVILKHPQGRTRSSGSGHKCINQNVAGVGICFLNRGANALIDMLLLHSVEFCHRNCIGCIDFQLCFCTVVAVLCISHSLGKKERPISHIHMVKHPAINIHICTHRKKGKTDLAYTYGKRSRNQYTFKRFATPPNPLADLSEFDRM